MLNLFGSIGEGRKAAGWSNLPSPHASAAFSRWSTMTNAWGLHTSRHQNPVNLFKLGTAGLCSDTLALCICVSPSPGSPRCQQCWRDLCEEGSGWCVCYVTYCHNIHQHIWWIYHLLATEDSNGMNKIQFRFMSKPFNSGKICCFFEWFRVIST